MNRFSTFTWLMWLALPITALRYWLVWDQLPGRMATHFAADGHPNGWMSRQVAFDFGLGLTAFVLLVFTVILTLMRREPDADKFSWAFLIFTYLVVAFIFYANESVIDYNLGHGSSSLGPIMLVVPLAIIALTAIYIANRRGQALPPQTAIATETHGSPAWALVFLVPIALELWIFATVRVAGVSVAGALLTLLFIIMAAFAWSGFQYRFSSAGIEISTLGFRLRSIPASHIEYYNPGQWSLLRGYGIRGVGNYRAYVWGNKVVRIKTTDGEVVLGHNDPEKILRDLDQMKQFAH